MLPEGVIVPAGDFDVRGVVVAASKSVVESVEDDVVIRNVVVGATDVESFLWQLLDKYSKRVNRNASAVHRQLAPAAQFEAVL
jgi:hypothetical protein